LGGQNESRPEKASISEVEVQRASKVLLEEFSSEEIKDMIRFIDPEKDQRISKAFREP